MMIAVRRDVIAATGGKQIPWESSSLTQQFRFASGPATGSPETMLFQIAARARDPMLMQLYLDRFPDGAHVDDVAQFLSAGTDATPNVARGSGDEARADLLWQLARQTRMRPLVELYLEEHPAGPHTEPARQLRDTLPRDTALEPEAVCERLATHPLDATASVAGVPFRTLARHAGAAVSACREAADANPDLPHYTALLARASLGAGEFEESIALYRDAADKGDLRAIWALANFLWDGECGVTQDRQAALELYERAAAAGSPDAMTNLAYALELGVEVPRDRERALSLFLDAAAAGSPQAIFNLGALAHSGVEGTGAPPIVHLREAARLGEPRGYFEAARLLDRGDGTRQDPAEAARMLLFGIASDEGRSLQEVTGAPEAWSPATLRAMQSALARAGLYRGPIDGLSGPLFLTALEAWRNGGFVPAALET